MDNQLHPHPDNSGPKQHVWHPGDGVNDLHDTVTNRDHEPIEKLLESYQAEQILQVIEIFDDDWEAGKRAPKATVLRRRADHLIHKVDYDLEVWRAGAFILGATGLELTMCSLCTEVHHIMHK